MRALTLPQPQATLVALGVVTIATNKRGTTHRGTVAIRSASKMPPGMDGPAGWFPRHSVDRDGTGEDWYLLDRDWPGREFGAHQYPIDLPLGAIVATVTLVDCVPIVAERGCSKTPGRGPMITVSANGEHVTGLTWANTVSPQRYIDKEFCERIKSQRPYGTFSPDRHALLLSDPKPVDPPVPCSGHSGLWTLPEDIERTLNA